MWYGVGVDPDCLPAGVTHCALSPFGLLARMLLPPKTRTAFSSLRGIFNGVLGYRAAGVFGWRVDRVEPWFWCFVTALAWWMETRFSWSLCAASIFVCFVVQPLSNGAGKLVVISVFFI